MAGIPDHAVFAVARVRTTFTEDLGTPDSAGIATGFWLAVSPHPPDFSKDPPILVFVTNKHVLDRRLDATTSPFRLSRVEIELRRKSYSAALGTASTASVNLERDTCFHDVANLEQSLFVHETADCAILCGPLLHNNAEPAASFHPPAATSELFLASFNGSAREIEYCDPVSFIGFPSTPTSTWWDEGWTLPIARLGAIASLPHLPFTNAAIKTSDVVLVSGLSFSGSSGSPVFTHSKHVPNPLQAALGEPPTLHVYDPQLVGVMSGHFDDPTHTPEMFRHSGLSYMTRSTAILELIQRARSAGFKNPSPFDGLNSLRARLHD